MPACCSRPDDCAYAAKDAETDTVWTSKDGVQASHRPDVQDLLQILPFHSLLVTAVYLCSPVTDRSAAAPERDCALHPRGVCESSGISKGSDTLGMASGCHVVAGAVKYPWDKPAVMYARPDSAV